MRVECKQNLDTVAGVIRDMRIKSLFVIKNDDGTDKVLLFGELRKTGEQIKLTYPRTVSTLNLNSIYASKDKNAEFFTITMLHKQEKPTLWQQIKNVFKDAKDYVLAWLGKE